MNRLALFTIGFTRMQAYGRNQISGQCSGFRFQQTINPDTRNLTPDTFIAKEQRR